MILVYLITLDMHTPSSRYPALRSISQSTRGFTLIELLIVIAIIGILASFILASLSTSRQKSRDGKRIAEMTQMVRTLELFYDSNQRYPSTTPAGFTGADAGIQILTSLNLIPSTPIPPPGTNATYIYRGIYDNSGTPAECTLATQLCTSFELGITLERSDNVSLWSDADQSVGAFYGGYPDCAVNSAGQDQCFDLKGG